MIDKAKLLRLIIVRLNEDLALFLNAAKTAHAAAIDGENQPDNKYDTTALEASYVAQGQANRAQELKRSIDVYKQLLPPPTGDAIRLTSLVTLEDKAGTPKLVFIGPLEGGLKINTAEDEIMIITPASPLGKSLLGKSIDDAVEITTGGARTSYQIIGFI